MYAIRSYYALLRRLSLTGKFSVISIVLLVPLVTSLAGVYISATEQIRIARGELDGLAYVDPKLLELLVCPLTKAPLEYDAEAQELISRQAGLAPRPPRSGHAGMPCSQTSRTQADESLSPLH